MLDLYQSIGGQEGCRKLAQAFYARVPRDPVLRAVYGHSFHCAVEALARFLSQFLGGPPDYAEQRWYLSLREAHARFRIGPREREAWMRAMRAAMSETNAPADLDPFFERASWYLINHPAESLSGPLAPAWDRHLALEEAVAAVRSGSPPRQSEQLKECFENDPMAMVALLGMALAVPALQNYVRQELEATPHHARAHYVYHRTLLNDAAVAGNIPIAEFLLSLGADPNGAGGHTPLYEVANNSYADTAGDMVRLLVRAGAPVSKSEGVQRVTPLHMAARRGNVMVAEALLDCGAEINPRDKRGDTPLQRAINCRKKEVADLLRTRGATA